MLERMEMSKNCVGKMPEGFQARGGRGGQAVKMAGEEKLFQVISGGEESFRRSRSSPREMKMAVTGQVKSAYRKWRSSGIR